MTRANLLYRNLNETYGNDVTLNEYEGSTLAALTWINGIIFTPIGGVLSGWLGRKRLLMVTTPIGKILN